MRLSRRAIPVLLTAALVIPTAGVLVAPAASAADPGVGVQPFRAGNLAVVRVGTGTAALSSAATPVFVDEYTPGGTLVQSIPMPTSVAGGDKPLTMSGSASSEGALALSEDGRYLSLIGYGATPGTAGVGGTTSAAVNRVVARLDGSGAVDTTTSLTDASSGNNPRGAVSSDGSQFWTTGGAGGVRYAALGGTSSVQLASAPTNTRVPNLAEGQLYVSSGSAPVGVSTIGRGEPTTAGQTAALLPGVTGATSPYAYTFLDRSPSVGISPDNGNDTLYVADDSAGILKYSFDGSVWTPRGSSKVAGGLRGLTGSVSGADAALFGTGTAASANPLSRITDTAAFDQPIAAAVTGTTTAPGNTAFRGVALTPAPAAPAAPAVVAPSITGQPQDATVIRGSATTLRVTAAGTAPLAYQWYRGTAGDTSAPVTGATGASFTTPALAADTSYWVRVTNSAGQVDSRTATVTVTDAPNSPPRIGPAPVAPLALTLGDPSNPPAGRTVDVADNETDVAALTTTVTSDNPGVATGGTTGTGATRSLIANPVGVGRATLTVTVSDGTASASTTFPVAVSGALPAGTLNHYGASDASTAVDLGDNAMVVADDETNTLRVYDRTLSRYPASTLDVRAAGLALRDSDPTREIDIEAAARTGNTIAWVGSQGQNSSNKTRLNRQELFSTTVTGSGTSATLALGGSYQKLRDDLVAWDDANGAPLGLRAAAGRTPEGDGTDATGFNIEGAEFSTDGTALYLAFRGPLTAGKAIVVPVTNWAALLSANPSAGPATFGAPLSWDLGGRGIREIRKNAANQYLIIAGPSGGGTGAAGEFRFYSWDGNPASQPLLRSGSLDSVAGAGKPEAIVSVPEPLTNASSVQVLTDSGDTVFYGDGVVAKELPTDIRKATSATVAAGTPPNCTTPPVSIGSVQGTTDISPASGSVRTVRGTVVGDYEGPSPALRGFYVEDAGDGDPATSDAIFVFDNGADRVSNGDVVQVTGAVSEYQGQTQLTSSIAGGAVDSCGRQAPVTPTDVTLPRVSATDLEPYEGMLVRFSQPLTVTEHFQLGRFGQVVVSSGGRLQQPTSVIRATDTAAVAAKQQANDRNRLIIDDASQSQNPDPIVFGRGGQPLSAQNTLRGGDTVTNPTGVLTYTWAGNAASPNAYRLRPVGALGGSAVFDPTNPRPTAPPEVGEGGVHVASANLLNFFNTFSNCTYGLGGAVADCRGAGDANEYQRQLAKEVDSLTFLDADAIGYMEMENDGYGPDSAVQSLVNALNARQGAGTWAFVNPDAATGITDSAGDDAIKAGILYRTAKLTPVAGATFADQNTVFERQPVAQTFTTADGSRFSLVANHFKSKGSCPTSGPDTDQRDGQSCWNAHRIEQARELARWVTDTVIPAAGDPDVMLVGDLNSYAGEDPIAVLEQAGYTNLVKAKQGPDAYSYVFDGQWGSLDYALSSASLTPQVTGADDAHHNADEPSVLDYNTDFKTPAQRASLYAPDRFRTSDHDPVRAGLALGTAPTVSGSPAAGTVGQPYSSAFSVAGSSPVTVSVVAGALPTGLSLADDGTVSGTPTMAGTATFTVRASNAYGSADLATSITIAPAATTTTLTAEPTKVRAGDPVTLTASVMGAVPPTGSVRFAEGTSELGTATISDGTAKLAITLPVGSHEVVAAYAGDANSAGSTSAPVTIEAVAPVTLGTSLPNGTTRTSYDVVVPHTGGEPVTFAVSSGELPAGLVLDANGRLHGVPTAKGTATFSVTATISVSSATQSYTVTIAAQPTRVTLSAPAVHTLHDTPTVTATVGSPAGGTAPTGAVQFAVDGKPLGEPVALAAGKASTKLPASLTVGNHQVSATYTGSPEFDGSTAQRTQTVQYALRITSPTAGSSIRAGQPVPITVTLTDVAGQPVNALESLKVMLGCSVHLSVSGAQSLSPTCPLYNPLAQDFVVLWPTAKKLTGPVTVKATVSYPGAPDQTVTVSATLS